jgi:hypothetical protein
MTEVPDHHGEDPLGPDRPWADLRPMIVYLAVVGAVFTLAARKDYTWAYVLGFVLTVVWVVGFVVSRDRPERWFRW